MKNVLSILAVSGLALAPVAPAAAQDNESVYKPGGPWALDYGDDYCRLGRVFSDGKDQIEVGIERVRPGAQIRIWIVGDAFKTFRGAEETGYTFLPSQTERMIRPIRSTRGAVPVMSLPEVTLTPFTPPAGGGARPGPGGPGGPGAGFAPPPKYDPAAELATAKGITAIGLNKGLTHPARIETGPLDAPIKALQDCTDDLVKSWGVDPVKNHDLSAQAFPSGPVLPAGMIGFADFAKLAGNNNMVRVLVDANGKPTNCHVTWATLGQDVNDKICQAVMTSGSFTPAKDAGGQAVASYWMGSPMFMMPVQGGRGGRR